MDVTLPASAPAIACLGALAYNALVALVFGYDKWLAQHERSRLRERTLLLLAAPFAAPGAWAGMKLFRHKTRKPKFSVGVPMLGFIQIVALGAFLYWCAGRH